MVTIAMALMLGVGVLGILLGGWMIYTLPRQSKGDTGSDLWTGTSLRSVQLEQTRDAQQVEIERLQHEVAFLRQQLAQPTATPRVIYTELGPPLLALILNAPVYQQQHPLSCESSAAAMAAQFYGIALDEETILNALPRHDNPHRGFRGNVDGVYGGTEDYGVYAEPLRQILQRWGLQAELFQGGVGEIRTHLRQGRVVLAWVTYELQVQVPRQVVTSDGQTVTLVPYQHVVLVTGYNQDGLWVNDPYSGMQTFYPEPDFVRSFSYLGNMGLVVGPQTR